MPDDYDETEAGDKQDEYLISPAVDLHRQGRYPLLRLRLSSVYGSCRTARPAPFTVEASTDGGKTWTALWNAKDSCDDEELRR